MHTQATPQQIQTLQQQVAALTSAVQLMARIKGERLTTAQVVERIGRTRQTIAAMVRRNPAAARARGYVKVGTRYRQMPGDNNALGRMKLVMPNRFSVYLHDTSNRSLFEQEERLLSHGCVRVAGALEFAELLLAQDRWAGDSVASIVEAGATRTVELAAPFPIYIAYFTRAPGDDGTLLTHPDVYDRD